MILRIIMINLLLLQVVEEVLEILNLNPQQIERPKKLQKVSKAKNFGFGFN